MHHTTPQRPREPRRRGAGDDGAALVEFAFVMSLLFLLIFGIITFGLILSFKQDVTRAAAEGARAGAVAFPADHAEAEAQRATEEAVGSFDRTCGGVFDNPSYVSSDGITCFVAIAPCDNDPTSECVTVELVYHYADYPLVARLPFISGFLPDTIRAQSVARTNA